MFVSYHAHAAHIYPDLTRLTQNLPNFPEADEEPPGYFDLDGQSATLGYDTRSRSWRATVADYSDLNPSITFDYGLLVTDALGTGGSLTRYNGYSEILVSGIYAPRSDFHMRLTAGQLHAQDLSSDALENEQRTVLQHSFLLETRRYWRKARLSPDLGLTVYAIEANGSDSGTAADEEDGASLYDEHGDAGYAAHGGSQGYILNLALHPSHRSRIELKREMSHFAYRFGDGSRAASGLLTHRIAYAHHFKNCVTLRGRYSKSMEESRLAVSLARSNWSIDMSRSVNSEASIQLRYSVPLEGIRKRTFHCNDGPERPPPFEGIVEAATQRPDQIPYEPLTLTAPL